MSSNKIAASFNRHATA